MIPEGKQSAVSRALREVFGVNNFENLTRLAGGLSTALVFRIVVHGNPYLLRLIMRTDEFGDPTRHFACMKIAADAGIAPRMLYANAEDRILITDFVDAKPFPDDTARLMALTTRRLHALPPFPKAVIAVNYFDTMDGIVRRFQAAKILPESATQEIFCGYAEVARAYPRNDMERVSSHNDLKPQNTLFDGKRVWIVDWESAFKNDRYVDLAVAANFFVHDEESEAEYLNEYCGEPPGEYRSSRFYLMRQAMHMFYGAFLMQLAASAGARIDPDLKAPDFRDFHRRLISGEVNVAEADIKAEYAKVHLVQLLRNIRSTRFKDALSHCSDNAVGEKID